MHRHLVSLLLWRTLLNASSWATGLTDCSFPAVIKVCGREVDRIFWACHQQCWWWLGCHQQCSGDLVGCIYKDQFPRTRCSFCNPTATQHWSIDLVGMDRGHFFKLLAIGGFMGLVPSMLHSEKKKANSSAKGAVHEPSQTTQVGLKLGMVLGTKWPLSSVLKWSMFWHMILIKRAKWKRKEKTKAPMCICAFISVLFAVLGNWAQHNA